MYEKLSRLQSEKKKRKERKKGRKRRVRWGEKKKKERKKRKWKKRSAENARDREDRPILFILLRTIINPFYLISFFKEDTLRGILHNTVWALSWEKSLNGIEVSSRKNLWSFATRLKPVSFDSILSRYRPFCN